MKQEPEKEENSLSSKKGKIFKKSQGAIRLYFHDHYKYLPETNTNTFQYFQLIDGFFSFRFCKTETIIHIYPTAHIEDM